MPQICDPASFEIDPIIPEKMSGKSIIENLALACFQCNNHKGPNMQVLLHQTNEKSFLLDHRVDGWDVHFVWEGDPLNGQTSKARSTLIFSANKCWPTCISPPTTDFGSRFSAKIERLNS